ncbi:hypothetical protein [Flavihumibacter sp. CACIAM 22H1]|uniref:hypothetical protein n=1 Tax=Flavihumibacter sp. CACIAM 22H1 TaxID=1812911 RepID=UPI0007A84C0A|nr:hypothetical protein [Flavihumibacter sp. CACIAM 22H1]KYP13687.1 MAG: hypothetical protein A1D16_01750 [Flavihumibacter sp. CACIAM 22H1]
MKIHANLFLTACLLLSSALASAQTKGSCSGTVYRSKNPLLQEQASTQSLQVADESAMPDPVNWSCKKSIEQVLKQQAGTAAFQGQLMVKIDCNGKASNAKFLQSNNPTLATQLIALINGSTGNKIAQQKGNAVSAFTIVQLISIDGQLQYNPLFHNQ